MDSLRVPFQLTHAFASGDEPLQGTHLTLVGPAQSAGVELSQLGIASDELLHQMTPFAQVSAPGVFMLKIMRLTQKTR